MEVVDVEEKQGDLLVRPPKRFLPDRGECTHEGRPRQAAVLVRAHPDLFDLCPPCHAYTSSRLTSDIYTFDRCMSSLPGSPRSGLKPFSSATVARTLDGERLRGYPPRAAGRSTSRTGRSAPR